MTDISRKGAFFSFKEAIAPETEVHATFRLPEIGHETTVDIVGIARRVKCLENGRWGAGVEFTGVSEKNRKAIQSFVAWQELGETL